MLQICMSDCVSKFGRLNKRALMKSWSLLLLSDSKLLELLSLVSPPLLCSSLICCNRRSSQLWPIWEHPPRPPWTCCRTPSDHLWCPINHPRPVDPMHPPPWPLGHPWHVPRPPGTSIPAPSAHQATKVQWWDLITTDPDQNCRLPFHLPLGRCLQKRWRHMTISKKKRKAFQYVNAEECDLAWQIAKKDEGQFAYERCLVQ